MTRRIILIAAYVLLAGRVFLLGADNHTEHAYDAEKSKMQRIPAGTFRMGSTDRRNERPVHTVFLSAFYIDSCEVTNEQWKRFVEANPNWKKQTIKARYHDGNYLKDWDGNDYPAEKATHPVVYVSWYAASAYAKWIGKRLPTEAEWEKAARGPKGYRYSYGDQYDTAKANTARTIGETTPVASYQPNDYALYDMTGSVLEWCSDWFGDDYYSLGPERNPKGPREGESRIMRGGCWNTFESRCTTTFRFFCV
ncbi:MAG: formylglycine-generating enzyme family protein, partial [Planctomycetes bacterium]|nr:formylglycine-generating enzyme family protein [Planctomycetota bacterium]